MHVVKDTNGMLTGPQALGLKGGGGKFAPPIDGVKLLVEFS